MRYLLKRLLCFLVLHDMRYIGPCRIGCCRMYCCHGCGLYRGVRQTLNGEREGCNF